jgi:hypothetical protein
MQTHGAGRVFAKAKPQPTSSDTIANGYGFSASKTRQLEMKSTTAFVRMLGRLLKDATALDSKIIAYREQSAPQ